MKRTTQVALLLIILLVAGFIITVMAWSKPPIKDPMAVGEIVVLQQDTPEIVHSVRGKKALFIGDSHTAADYGWQYQLCKKTGMIMQNTAVGGKQTGWMLEVARLSISSNYDYCFIYGGANDMAGNRPPIKSVKNIQAIVNLCLAKQVIKGATVVKTHCISRTDCGDFLCHMTASGHRKMGEFVISACRFKKI